MRYLLIVFLPIFLIGCSKEEEPEWKAASGEPERKARVQALVRQLADESLENRQAAYAELRDTVVRKRDIPDLTKEIARNADPVVTMSLQKLITSIVERRQWRLPEKGWTTDIKEHESRWKKEFQDLGCDAILSIGQDGLFLEVRIEPENRTGVINLILTLEPELLTLRGYLTNMTFLGTLASLERLDLQNTNVTDLPALNGLPNLSSLNLQNTEVTDLTPLKGLRRLSELHLQNAGVTDLTPLIGLRRLSKLHLQNTGVTDLTPLKGMPYLKSLYLQNTKVTDLTPLKGMPSLRWLDLQNTGVTDLTPLKGMPDLMILGKGNE